MFRKNFPHPIHLDMTLMGLLVITEVMVEDIIDMNTKTAID